MTAARLAVTAAFCREMRNFPTTPKTQPVGEDVIIYHALPYGLRDGMGGRVWPEHYVDIGSALETKRAMLAQHRSQKEWLDESQGVDAYLAAMEEMSAGVGRMSGRFRYAEGWRKRSHLGFSEVDRDPLRETLGGLVAVDEEYRRRLEGPAAGSKAHKARRKG